MAKDMDMAWIARGMAQWKASGCPDGATGMWQAMCLEFARDDCGLTDEPDQP